MVSPDWRDRDRPACAGRGSGRGSGTRWPAPTSHGIRVQCSMAYLAIMPGVVGGAAGDDDDLVDLAQLRRPRCAPRRGSAGPSRVDPAEQGVGDRLRLLGDLLEHEVVVAALLGGGGVPVDVVRAAPRPGRPSKSVTVTPSRRSSTTWSWPSSIASRVCAMNAATSRGEEVLAVADADHQRGVAAGADDHVGRVGVHRDQRERALQPAADLPHRLGQVAGRGERPRRAGGRRPRCRSRRRSSWPRSASSARSAAKFSMMPLWTTATRPALSRCGWALASVGAPWVAQRVWPMPVVAGGQRAARPAPSPGWPACRPSSRRPARRRRARRRPAESYPRYSSRLQPGDHDVEGGLGADVTHDSAHGGQLKGVWPDGGSKPGTDGL